MWSGSLEQGRWGALLCPREGGGEGWGAANQRVTREIASELDFPPKAGIFFWNLAARGAILQ